jgi:hypothetical protein
MMKPSLAEEAFGPGRVPFGREQEFDGLAGRVHGAIQIFVFPFDLYIGLVRAVALFVGFRCGRQLLFSSGA